MYMGLIFRAYVVRPRWNVSVLVSNKLAHYQYSSIPIKVQAHSFKGISL